MVLIVGGAAMVVACGLLFRSAPEPASALSTPTATTEAGASPAIGRADAAPRPRSEAPRRESTAPAQVATTSLVGVVVDEDQRPLPRFELAWSGPTGASGVAQGRDGSFRIDALAVGRYELEVRSEGNLDRRVVTDLHVATADPVEIRVRPACSLAVMVQDERGRTVRGAEIRVEAVEGPSDALPSGVRLVYSDVVGRASAGKLPPGEYRVGVSNGELRTVHLARGSAHEVVLRAPPRARFEVIVRDGDDRPLPGAVVRVSKSVGGEVGRQVADRDGRARFEIVAADQVEVRAWKHGFAPRAETWTLPRERAGVLTLEAVDLAGSKSGN